MIKTKLFKDGWEDLVHDADRKLEYFIKEKNIRAEDIVNISLASCERNDALGLGSGTQILLVWNDKTEQKGVNNNDVFE
jgi:hypothetical protein